jgi:VacB/RNase II family 3'-5' exoribonuclease
MNLQQRAREVAVDAGFKVEWPPAALQQVANAELPSAPGSGSYKDLRHLPWSSIDNTTSWDLDQVEYAEELPDGRIRLLIGIADVDTFVPENSSVDQVAALNTTSVYAGVAVFPMLPEKLSNGLTSLLPDQERLAMVVDYTVAESGEVCCTAVIHAWVVNRARLAYEAVGDWLETSKSFKELESRPWLEAQLKLQAKAASWLRELRRKQGALRLDSIEMQPVMKDGNVVQITEQRKNRARELIETLMIAANSEIAEFLGEAKEPSLQRLVRTPERWPKIREIAASLGTELPQEPDPRALADFMASRKKADPARFPDLSLAIVKLVGKGEYVVTADGKRHPGHFGLAVHDYTHSTAPNRRFVDLVTQRILKSVIHRAPRPYTLEKLEEIAARCMDREAAARKVERLMKKVIAAHWLAGKVGQTFRGIVTGVTRKGVFARMISPPVEGKVVKGAEGLDVGDQCHFRLLQADEETGFIDFERVPTHGG